jgi:DNA-binding transcriptional MerR regulator
MRIGELSEATGASPRALRYYEQLGLISSERRVNGYRDFDESAADTVRMIKRLLELGLPTEVIRDVLPCTGPAGPAGQDCGALMARVSVIRDEMADRAERFAAVSDALTRFIERSAA